MKKKDFLNLKLQILQEIIRGRMAITDVVVGNLTTLYLAMIAVIKAYGFATGRSFAGAFVLIISTAVLGFILIVTLTWDVSRKATYVLTPDHGHEMCGGGICWHGVAIKSPASELRFRLPQHQPYNHNRS